MKPIRRQIKEAGHTIPDFLDYVKENGRWEAMRLIGIKDYVCFDRFLKEETHEPNFGVAPTKSSRIDTRPPDLQLMAEYAGMPRLLRTLAGVEAEIARKKKRIEELERRAFDFYRKEEPELQPSLSLDFAGCEPGKAKV